MQPSPSDAQPTHHPKENSPPRNVLRATDRHEASAKMATEHPELATRCSGLASTLVIATLTLLPPACFLPLCPRYTCDLLAMPCQQFLLVRHKDLQISTSTPLHSSIFRLLTSRMTIAGAPTKGLVLAYPRGGASTNNLCRAAMGVGTERRVCSRHNSIFRV